MSIELLHFVIDDLVPLLVCVGVVSANLLLEFLEFSLFLDLLSLEYLGHLVILLGGGLEKSISLLLGLLEFLIDLLDGDVGLDLRFQLLLDLGGVTCWLS